jgi:hypothetical protein
VLWPTYNARSRRLGRLAHSTPPTAAERPVVNGKMASSAVLVAVIVVVGTIAL